MQLLQHAYHVSARCISRIFIGIIMMVALASAISSGMAAEQTRSYLREKFQDGDIPTSQDFAILIDSSLHYIDDRFVLNGIGTASDGGALYLDEGSLVEVSIGYGLAGGLSLAWANRTGFMPVTFSYESELHYGYFQILSGADGSGALYPMQFQYFVYEDQANTPLITSLVPEPSAALLFALGSLTLLGVSRSRKRI